VEEVSKKYENIIQDLKRENLNLLEKLQKENLERKPRNLEALKESLIRVSTELNLRWNQLFDIAAEDYLSITHSFRIGINNRRLKDFIEDLVQACSKENLWKNLDRLDIIMRGDNSITDEGLKVLALKLGPQLSNLQHFVLDMSRILKKMRKFGFMRRFSFSQPILEKTLNWVLKIFSG